MIKHLPSGAIHVNNINLWAHVGVLDSERDCGQSFLLDVTLWLDLEKAAKMDDLSSTLDYSIAINRIQQLSFQINCQTIEHFSKRILDCLEELYGDLPMKIYLRKCSAPVQGFSGDVGVEMGRHFPNN